MSDVDLPLNLAQLRLQEQFRSLDEGGSLLDECNPEFCVAALREPWHISAVKRMIRQADYSWIIEFFEAGGIDGLWDALEASATGYPRPTSLLRCIECTKALLSHPNAIDKIVRSQSEKYVKRLLLGGCEFNSIVMQACTNFHLLLIV